MPDTLFRFEDAASARALQTRLVDTYGEPGASRGSRSDLMDDGETIGAVLRPQDGVKPVFVSIGHRISLDAACARILALAPRHCLPETTHAADGAVRAAMRAARAI